MYNSQNNFLTYRHADQRGGISQAWKSGSYFDPVTIQKNRLVVWSSSISSQWRHITLANIYSIKCFQLP